MAPHLVDVVVRARGHRSSATRAPERHSDAMLLTPNSQCPVCHGALSGSDFIAVPHFVRQRGDRMWPLSGALVHLGCFEAHPLKSGIMEVLGKLRREAAGLTPCEVCGESVSPGENSFSVGYLAPPPQCATRYSLLSIHCSCFSRWPERAAFVRCIGEVTARADWGGGRLLVTTRVMWAPPRGVRVRRL